jgi:hypothetical protein
LDRLKQGKLDSERKRGSGEQSDQEFGKKSPNVWKCSQNCSQNCSKLQKLKLKVKNRYINLLLNFKISTINSVLKLLT